MTLERDLELFLVRRWNVTRTVSEWSSHV